LTILSRLLFHEAALFRPNPAGGANRNS